MAPCKVIGGCKNPGIEGGWHKCQECQAFLHNLCVTGPAGDQTSVFLCGLNFCNAENRAQSGNDAALRRVGDEPGFDYDPDDEYCAAGQNCVVTDASKLTARCNRCGAHCHAHCAPTVNHSPGGCTGCNPQEAPEEGGSNLYSGKGKAAAQLGRPNTRGGSDAAGSSSTPPVLDVSGGESAAPPTTPAAGTAAAGVEHGREHPPAQGQRSAGTQGGAGERVQNQGGQRPGHQGKGSANRKEGGQGPHLQPPLPPAAVNNNSRPATSSGGSRACDNLRPRNRKQQQQQQQQQRHQHQDQHQHRKLSAQEKSDIAQTVKTSFSDMTKRLVEDPAFKALLAGVIRSDFLPEPVLDAVGKRAAEVCPTKKTVNKVLKENGVACEDIIKSSLTPAIEKAVKSLKDATDNHEKHTVLGSAPAKGAGRKARQGAKGTQETSDTPQQVVLSDIQYKKLMTDVSGIVTERVGQVIDNVQAWGKYFLERQASGAQTPSASDTTSHRFHDSRRAKKVSHPPARRSSGGRKRAQELASSPGTSSSSGQDTTPSPPKKPRGKSGRNKKGLAPAPSNGAQPQAVQQAASASLPPGFFAQTQQGAQQHGFGPPPGPAFMPGFGAPNAAGPPGQQSNWLYPPGF